MWPLPWMLPAPCAKGSRRCSRVRKTHAISIVTMARLPRQPVRVERLPDEGSASAVALSAVPSRLAEPAVGGKVSTLCPLRVLRLVALRGPALRACAAGSAVAFPPSPLPSGKSEFQRHNRQCCPPCEGMSTLVSDRFKMDSPSSGPPLGTGAASLLEGACASQLLDSPENGARGLQPQRTAQPEAAPRRHRSMSVPEHVS